MASLSVAIISFNEEENIAKTINAIKPIADEIIVLDSNSTDKTKEIASSLGASVYTQDWLGHIGQKNACLKLCTKDWILALDCDEVVSDVLRLEIKKVLDLNDKKIGYLINRKTFYCNKLLEHAWQKDIKFRLFAREVGAKWGGYDPHDVLLADVPKKLLNGDLVHYSYKNIAQHFEKTIFYAKLTAVSYNKMGKKFRLYKLLLSPFVGFFKDFFVKKAFLDGTAGLIAGFSSFFYVFLKYAFLWEIQKNINNNNKNAKNKK